MVVGLTVCVPDNVFVPLHAPVAVHEVASLELQVRVEEPLRVMLPGLALSDTVGAGLLGGAVTVICAESDAVPPSPVQLSEYVDVAVGETLCVPVPAFAPLQAPLAVQELALEEDHVSVAESPETMLAAFESSETVGAAEPGGGTLASLGSSFPEPHPAASAAKAATNIHAVTPLFRTAFICPNRELCWTEC